MTVPNASSNIYTEIESFSNPLTELPAKDVENPFEATLSKKGGRYTLLLKNRTKRPMVSRYGVEIIDDRGNSMIEPIISSDLRFRGKSENQNVFQADVDLPDGYYIVRAKVVSVNDLGEEHSAFAETYLAVMDSEKTSVTREEFHKNSLHHTAFLEEKQNEEN